jgi:hypothetical protein
MGDSAHAGTTHSTVPLPDWQVYALVRRGDLPAIKIGGRGQWRVEDTELEAYIAGAYEKTRDFIAKHPFVGDDSADGSDRSDEPVTPTPPGPASPR